ncbi:hypothetical protein D3C84_345950 [compost metagenome]
MKPHRLLTALSAGLLGLLALLPAAQAEESCASIIARAEYPRGRVVEFPFAFTTVSANEREMMNQSYQIGDLMRLPADASGPVVLVVRLERDLPRADNFFKTDIPGLGMDGTLDYRWIGEQATVTLQPGQSLADALEYSLLEFRYGAIAGSELAEGMLDIGMTPGIKLECASGGGEPALVIRPIGVLAVEHPTCKVVTEQQVVDLGEHAVSTLKLEQGTPWVSFDVNFSGCSGLVGSVRQLWDSAGNQITSDRDPNFLSVEPQGSNLYHHWYHGYWLGLEGDSWPAEYQPLVVNFEVGYADLSPGQTAFSLPMRARYYRTAWRELEPGPKNASLVLMIRYD